MLPFQGPPASHGLLRFIACGSVDDGKSTLIGRLLYESKSIFDDQLHSLENESRQVGTQGDAIDFALLVDGLQAEREQGITIDVAYRFFATPTRRFIVADTPGHEQYTRNMATGASTAELAILLVDARKGMLIQTQRHSRIVAMMGIRHVVLAINKMDLVGFSQTIRAQIEEDYRRFAEGLGFSHIQAIPVSALRGDNVTTRSAAMPWYSGPPLLEYLEAVDVTEHEARKPFRMPVQYINRPNPDFRGYSGTISQGDVRLGDTIRIVPSTTTAHIKEIRKGFDLVPESGLGESVTLTLVEDVDISRGDVLSSENDPIATADQFEARLLWMHQQPMLPGRQYLVKIATRESVATITSIKYREDINTGAQLATGSLAMNDLARVIITATAPLPYELYSHNRDLGGFILIDRVTFDTVALGVIEAGLLRPRNIHLQGFEVSPASRALQKHQQPVCVWFTGLQSSGKSTIANLLDKHLNATGRHTYVLDGDNLRHGLTSDLGFSEADRIENIRRVAHVARLMFDAGLIVLVSFISPFRNERRSARELFPEGAFREVFVDTPIEECERRDVKGLYALARRGELTNFTGLDSPYEAPEKPEAHVRTLGVDPETCVEQLVKDLAL